MSALIPNNGNYAHDITSMKRGNPRKAPSRELRRTVEHIYEQSIAREVSLRAERNYVEKKNDAITDATKSAIGNIYDIGAERYHRSQVVDQTTQIEMLAVERDAAAAIGRNIRDFGRWE